MLLVKTIIAVVNFLLSILARSSMRNSCYKNDRQHFAGDQSSTVHVRCNGGANVQGRE